MLENPQSLRRTPEERSEEETVASQRILRGDLRYTHFLAKKCVRIYLSSTHDDFTLERDIIHTDAVPFLERFCRALKLDFMLVDMRWGAPSQCRSVFFFVWKNESICFEFDDKGFFGKRHMI